MKTISKFLKITLFSILAITAFSCDDDDDGSGNDTQTVSIAAVVEGSSEFSLLEMALKDTDLFATFEGEGTFTVFAPNNDAFEKLLTELGLEYDEVPKDLLASILKMHVLTTEVRSTDLMEGASVATFEGENITTSLNPPSITDPRGRISRIILTDAEASNGIIHFVDTVILPAEKPMEEMMTIAEIVKVNDNFEMLETALEDAELTQTFDGNGTFTVFAPTDAAFEALLAELGVEYSDLTKETLDTVLKMHVLNSVVTSGDLTDSMMPLTLFMEALTINLNPNKVTDPNDREAAITTVDIMASNGVIHIIDKVLLNEQ
ncbi:fasciclin domain-containing protein [Aquimarina agarivorans]|uniref:fasciclin domain-containing protein n=1 Tax=Aquimarina agarivorans TaxID=980584 RepID=UPI000248EC09|nr:fasciclin domain-containing protein [Aquimarina agarivorans]